MNLLLDTVAFIWLCSGDDQLSNAAARALNDPANTVSLSAVSAWEIGLKNAKGKLKLPASVETWVPAMISHHRLALMSIEAHTTVASTKLPSIHSDPFDRLLVATALQHRLTIITPDAAIAKYPGLKTIW